MRFTHIVFDMDMTLFDYPAAQLDAFRGCTEPFGIEYTKEIHKIYNDCNERQWRFLEQSRVTMKELQINRFKNFLKRIGKNDIDAGEMNSIYSGLLAEGGHLIPGARETVQRLAKDHILAIATNGSAAVQRGRLGKSGLAGYFKYVFISEEIGQVKPDTGYFDHMVRTMELKPTDTALMVGDSLLTDICGAARVGITTCWANYTAAKNRTEIKPNYEISCPNELLSIIDQD